MRRHGKAMGAPEHDFEDFPREYFRDDGRSSDKVHTVYPRTSYFAA